MWLACDELFVLSELAIKPALNSKLIPPHAQQLTVDAAGTPMNSGANDTSNNAASSNEGTAAQAGASGTA